MARFRLPQGDPINALFGVASLAQNQKRLALAEEEALGAKALRDIHLQRFQKEISEEAALPGDISTILRAAQGGAIPTMGGQPVEPQDLSDLADQNLLALKQTAPAQTLPDLASSVSASSLARVMGRRPQVIAGLGLKTPEQVDKATQQKAGRQKIAGILAETPTTPEAQNQWWDRITGAWLESGLDKADDILEARMKMKKEDPTAAAKATSTFLGAYRESQAAGKKGLDALADAAAEAARQHPTAGAIIKDLVEKFKPTETKTPEQIEAEAAARKRGEVSETPKKTPAEIEAEAAARKRGEVSATPPDPGKAVRDEINQMRLSNMKAAENAGNVVQLIQAGQEVPAKEVRLHLAALRPIYQQYRRDAQDFGVSQEDRDFAKTEARNIQATISVLTDYLQGAGKERPMPGRAQPTAPQRVEQSGDVGATRAGRGRPAPTELPAAQAELGAMSQASAEQQRAKYVAVVARLYPNKTWNGLTAEEKQRVVDAINRGE